MFLRLNTRDRILALLAIFLFVALGGYLFICRILTPSTGLLQSLLNIGSHPQPLIFSAGIGGLVVVILAIIPSYDLKNIKSKDVGDGQHGSSRWATSAEIKENYLLCRDGKETIPGFVVGRLAGEWIVDTSDKSLLLLAPPGAGKTTANIVPSIYYNAYVNRNTGGQGASMILTDLKGELLRLCGNLLREAGYRILYINLRNPFCTYRMNLMHHVNKHMDNFLAASGEEAQLICYGQAERYAKILAQSIVHNISVDTTSDASAYFNETAQGLLTGIILLVAQYGQPGQRHLLSVFNLIIELNKSEKSKPTEAPTNKLQELLAHIDSERIKSHVGAAMSADFRTSMNIFSSALGKLVGLIDAELEQMISGHSDALNDIDFIKQPTAIFLICPDENPTRYFFGSLFLRYFLTDLIAQARELPTGELPRKVLCLWDEFGNMPAIKDVDVLFSAARNAGIRLLPTLQSLAQLRKNYNETTAKIIRETCQITVTTYVAPMARETAKEISDTLGNRTVQSGSISTGRGGSQTIQMIGKPLMSPDEIINMPWGSYIVMKSGCRPMKTTLKYYKEYLPAYTDYIPDQQIQIEAIQRMSQKDINKLSSVRFILKKGMFH